METPNTDEPRPEHSRRAQLLFYLSGVSDIALGVVLAVFGPGLIGGDPKLMWICGGLLASLGVPKIWFGRRSARGRQAEDSSSFVFKAPDQKSVV
jgi:hypothetical protein